MNPSLVAKLLHKTGHQVSMKDVYNRRAKLIRKGSRVSCITAHSDRVIPDHGCELYYTTLLTRLICKQNAYKFYSVGRMLHGSYNSANALPVIYLSSF